MVYLYIDYFEFHFQKNTKKYIIICWEDHSSRSILEITTYQTCLKISHKKNSRTLSLWLGFEFHFLKYFQKYFILFSILWLYILFFCSKNIWLFVEVIHSWDLLRSALVNILSIQWLFLPSNSIIHLWLSYGHTFFFVKISKWISSKNITKLIKMDLLNITKLIKMDLLNITKLIKMDLLNITKLIKMDL